MNRTGWTTLCLASLALGATAVAADTSANTAAARALATTQLKGAPIADALANATDDVRIYNDHLTTLASPYMEGRVPGSEGMERARAYVEYYLTRYGAEPAFPAESGEAFSSYRDPFALGGTWNVSDENMLVLTSDGPLNMKAEEDFVFTGLGQEGTVAGRAVFVGYSIDNGPDDYSSYAEEDDLTGKIAVMLRFEPMDGEGKSRWNEGGSWTGRASFNNKLQAAERRGAAAIIVINTPGADDDRIDRLDRFASGGGASDVPVFMMSGEAGERLIEATDPESRSLGRLRRRADRGGGVVELDAAITLKGKGERKSISAENVGGVFKGTGDLADEWIVVGAHMDHLGMGYFGSRTGPGELHPGADDNASGSAGVLLLAKQISERIAELPKDEPRRSILLICFDGEESGLNGSRHYVSDPIAPIENHVLMMNWDMIGRITEDRVGVSGLDTGDGMRAFFEPFFEGCGLDVKAGSTMIGASDHTSFSNRRIPVIFGHIDGLHADYHTPADVSWKINRVGATKTVLLFADMVMGYAGHDEVFEYAAQQSASRGPEMDIKVRMGVVPANYSDEDPGIPISGVSPDGPADKAGLKGGDRLVRWDGVKIGDIMDWMGMLSKHEPGDEVKVGVKRDGEEITLTVKLEAR